MTSIMNTQTIVVWNVRGVSQDKIQREVIGGGQGCYLWKLNLLDTHSKFNTWTLHDQFWFEISAVPESEFVKYKEKYYMNENEVCHSLGREPNETAVCEPVQPPTKHIPIVGWQLYHWIQIEIMKKIS